ncbi:hypothetical protein [Halorussus sp. MSC15.2]|uniref:hypothetical protein n=1 Tax=Halorussus sp. MSC15.2 TaxID=2283638 RepID=UPI0013D015B9|nr:hypothetical protein [Halorussus sp. MSC15.2]NEU55688.1 hypothetical protein [Halorussus sp. MSC15.2]
MALSRRELLGYAVAGTTGTGITATARRSDGTDAPDESESGVGQNWQLGGVYARPAEIGDTAVTFRAAVESAYETDYEVEVNLFYRPKPASGGGDTTDAGAKWRRLATETGPLADDIYLEATASGLEPGRTYEYRAEATLTDYEGQSRRVSETLAVTAGDPCSGPSTNCLRVETLAPKTNDAGSEVTLRGSAKGVDAYDEVTGHFFYQREDGEKQWTDYVELDGDGGSSEFSVTLSDLPTGSYTYNAEARGEGGETKNMYGEGREQQFRVE